MKVISLEKEKFKMLILILFYMNCNCNNSSHCRQAKQKVNKRNRKYPCNISKFVSLSFSQTLILFFSPRLLRCSILVPVYFTARSLAAGEIIYLSLLICL